MGILMESCFVMDVNVKFYVFCFCLVCSILERAALQNIKIWKPNNNILNRNNWIDPDSNENCGEVEFGEYNTAPIYVDKLTAKKFELPYTGEINLLDKGYLRVLDSDSNEKTNCLKLKGLQTHEYLDPSNWESDVSDNPAVPDREKLPCEDDTIKLPNNLYSGMSMDHLDVHVVSSVIIGNGNTTKEGLEDDDINQILRYPQRCGDPTGCVCNDDKEDIHCPPLKKPSCLSPIHPKGFCHAICGAYTSFKPAPGFGLKNIEETLKGYSDVFTHVSKVDKGLIQVVFAEKEYSGDSVVYAEEFFKKLQGGYKEFRISHLTDLKASGAQTGGSSFGTVFLSSLIFVLGIFTCIFCIYGDRRWLTNFRFRTATSFPLTSTYRARFSSREDESGLIFDTQSIAGSVLNLRQSFDNPMFSEASKVEDNIEKIDTTEANAPEVRPDVTLQNDPLYDLKKLNGELHEELGSDVVEIAGDIQNSRNFKTLPLIGNISPLIEIEEIED